MEAQVAAGPAHRVMGPESDSTPTSGATEATTDGGKRRADGNADGGLPRRSKKGKKGRRNGNGSSASGSVPAEPQPQELVAVSPLAPNAEILQEGRRPVMLSKVERAPQMTLGEDRLSVTSHKGYRTVRATHGTHEGTWYYEVTVRHLGSTGHARVGWATRKAELQAPVGYDQHGYSYRDLEGTKVHKGLREEYGEAYREGDVIGCLLHLPPGGCPFTRTRNDAGTYKGNLYLKEEPADEAAPKELAGAVIAFSRNGVSQGIAYRDMVEGTYCPAVSLYTLPEQAEGATLSVNFGPGFAHAPPELEGVPAARPVADLAALDDLAPAPHASPVVQQLVKQKEDSTARQEDGGTGPQPHGSRAATVAAAAAPPDPAG